MSRAGAARAFLDRIGWGDARIAPLAGDASFRRYDRLTGPAPGRGAVLMDAPPDRGEDVRPFLRIAAHLADLGLSPPEILAADPAAGFVLMEDLGDDLLAKLAARAPADEPALYAAAVDTLVALHRHPPPGDLPAYDAARMGPLAALAATWYRRGATGAESDAAAQRLAAETTRALAALAPAVPVLALRDYHAENLIWLPDRAGPARIGLLDFQDAMAGHPAYDLVSLTEDARRDVPPALAAALVARYVAATGAEPDRFAAAAAALSAQRNLRILGVFARLSMRDGRPRYVALIPRVWGHLTRALAHPDLAGLRAAVAETLPPPDDRILDRLAGLAAPCPER